MLEIIIGLLIFFLFIFFISRSDDVEFDIKSHEEIMDRLDNIEKELAELKKDKK